MNSLNFFQNRLISAVLVLMSLFVLAMIAGIPQGIAASGLDARPPSEMMKLVFIHHSCGENWLSDHNGRLAGELQENNYFVSDTNYGWGPDAIGDRTDIEDWPQWFTGPDRERYLQALFLENQPHSPYDRTVAEPAGENRIVMFKSCFPNSSLAGHPNDPPQRGRGLTVANAKAIYNDLLSYFMTRPDKLFIAVTAPPLQDRSQAQNARAFNQWLVRDWLKNYSGKNVAVFDFYNVLTGRQNHHRYHDGQIQYITDKGGNTLAYPSDPGDDHPNVKGNRKATAEFIPLLNVVVNKWLETAPLSAGSLVESHDQTTVETVESPPATESEAPAVGADPGLKDGPLDDFESDRVPWQVFKDDDPVTRLTSTRDASKSKNGHHALKMEFHVAPDGWVMYSRVHSSPRDWSHHGGLVIVAQANKPDLPVIFNVYGGTTPDDLKHFEYKTTISDKGVNGWQKYELPWTLFKPPAWQGGDDQTFNPEQSMGMSFIFFGEDGPIEGILWVDDISMLPR